MKEATDIERVLRDKGSRMTKLRLALIVLFSKNHEPRTAKQILAALAKRGIVVNKTSVYRELEFFVKEGVLRELRFGNKEAVYEAAGEHHHHVICRSCNTIEEVQAPTVETAMNRIQAVLAKRSKFSDVEHSLEFFGICQECR